MSSFQERQTVFVELMKREPNKPVSEAILDEIIRLRAEVAALAEQNAKMREALQGVDARTFYGGSPLVEQVNSVAKRALSLPDLATPALNRIRAEGMRMAAEICEHISDEYREREGRRYPELKTDAESGASDCESSIRARADELEKNNG